MALLQILIPTYNREKYLSANLRKLAAAITALSLQEQVELIISNNCSSDDTAGILTRNAAALDNVRVKLYNQETNIGLENNTLFLLEHATASFVMFLGDDDFIATAYLEAVVEKIKQQNGLSCIVPAYQGIDLEGNPIAGITRDLGLEEKCYPAGFDNCLENGYRGHQMSGLVVKREGLFEMYRQQHVHNIYPFIYFVAWSCLQGITCHLPQWPVLVSVMPQKDKDWNYDISGLFGEIFDNYRGLTGINVWQRAALESRILKEQSWRYEIHLRKGKKMFARSVLSIVTNKNTSWPTRILFPARLTGQLVKKIIRKCLP